MATYRAITAIGQAILAMLEAACPRDDFPGASFALFQADDFKKGLEEGVSLFLYRVAVNPSRRALPARLGLDGKRYRPTLPLDLFYLLTPWARSASVQHRLLGWSMRALEDTTVLPAGALNRAAPEAGTFHDDETVEVVHDPLSLSDLFNIWEINKQGFQISAGYVARLVPIDSALELPSGPPVQTRDLRPGKLVQP